MFFSAPPVVRAAFRRRRGVFIGTGLLIALLVLGHIKQQEITTMVEAVRLDLEEYSEVLGVGGGDKRRHPHHLLKTAADEFRSADVSVDQHSPERNSRSKGLVVARMKSEPVHWINETLPYKGHGDRNATKSVAQEWDVSLYTTDDTSTEYHTPLNKGHEAMAYLTYIIENYNSFPDVTVFLHSHRSSWHDNFFNMNTVEMLARLNLDRVVQHGFLNLRCNWEPGCPDHIHPRVTVQDAARPEMAIFAQAWKEIFPLEEPPERLSQPCCAQFAVSAERLRLLPRSRYIALRDWIVNTELEDSVSGRVFEYLYHYIWTGESVLCPDEHECYCKNYGICFGGKYQYQEYVAKRKEWLWFKTQVDEYIDEDTSLFSMSELVRLFHGKSKSEKSEAAQGVTDAHSGDDISAKQNAQENEEDRTGVKGSQGIFPDQSSTEVSLKGEPAKKNTTTDNDWQLPKMAEMAAKVEELTLWLADRLSHAKQGIQASKSGTQEIPKQSETSPALHLLWERS